MYFKFDGFFPCHLPDCLRLNSDMSESSSGSNGGCNEADRTEGPFGIVTGNNDIDDDGVESTDFLDSAMTFSLSVDKPNEPISSTTSISDAPFPVASGILFNGLIDEEE